MNRKRALSIFIMLIMLITLSFPSVAVKTDTLIKISDWKGLYNIRNNLSADYILVKDLNEKSPGYALYAGSSADGGKGWLPIAAFTGSLTGNNKTISGLFINRPESDNIGLFGNIYGGKINNLNLQYVDITGHGYVGSIAGGIIDDYNTESSIMNCNASGIVKGEYTIGGIVGIAGTYAPSLSNCNSSISVIGYTDDSEITEQNVGGLAGVIGGPGFVINSYSTGNVTGNRDNIGGLVGLIEHNGTTIDNSYATGNILGQNNVGGLIGYATWIARSVITNSYATGNVVGNEYVGGLIGFSRGTDTINCYALGDVLGTSNVGGLTGILARSSRIIDSHYVGRTEGSFGVGGLTGVLTMSSITGSYANGQVTGSQYVGGITGSAGNGVSILTSYSLGQISGISCVGGIAGSFGQGFLQDCYTLCDVSGTSNVGGIVGHTINYMNLIRTYAAGLVSGTEYVGGLAGSYYSDSIPIGFDETYIDNYWDVETTGQTNPVLIGTGLTTEEMVQMSNFSGWDFENVWTIEEGLSYPYLRWQGDVNIPYVGDAPINNPSVIVTTDQTTYVRYNIVNIEATVSDSLGSPVVGSTLKITIVEPRKGSIVLSQELETNSEGKVFTTFEILRTTAKGTYSVTAEIIGTEVTHTCYFEVK